MRSFALCLRFLALPAAIVLLPIAQAQKPSLTVANTTVTLGARVEPVVARLRKTFLVRDGDGPTGHTWLVSRSVQKFPIATIYSHNGVIVGVEHSLSETEPESALDLFNVIYKAATRVSNAPVEAFCKLTPRASYDADPPLPMSKESVRFDCGPYSFYIVRNTFQTEEKLTNGFLALEQVGLTE